MKHLKIFTLLTISTLSICIATAQQVKIVGQMKDVMKKGKLFGNISLDTISDKEHLLGIGPIEYLTGEILIIDGRSYKSTVLADSTLKVEETYNLKAPFFGYANVAKWYDQSLPDSVETIKQLEIYLNQITKNSPRPLMFKLMGTVEKATIHVVNLPKDSKVKSAEDAHKGQVKYNLSKKNCEIIGFFSTEHKTIFTHQDTFLHMHLITADRKKMGHLDEVLFKKNTMVLSLPFE
ncbi:MAG: acetolactate decarboxylase [Bacteroidia bacterium]|nr:acetolactate decarboxylase [Bacteroidia bacterium]